MDDLLALYRDQISMAPVREQECNGSNEPGHHGERRSENNRRDGERHRECRFNPSAGRRLDLVRILNRVAGERGWHFEQ